MKKIILIAAFFMSQLLPGVVEAQSKKKGSATASYDSGIGVHLGDLTAISYKKNMGTQGFEVNLGVSPYFGGYSASNYFSNANKFNGYYYSNGSFDMGVAVQFHYLFHYALPMEGLRWYWGLGPQFRARQYNVSYVDPNNFYYTTTRQGIDVALGLDGVLGAEYKFKKLPLAVYADVVPFTEFVSRFWVYPTGGIGARYTF